MPRAEEIIQHLPDIYQVGDRTLLLKVLQSFATEMDGIESSLFEVMKAHWVDHADELGDLVLLGALFDIRRREGEELEPYRQRLKQTVAAYLAGVGTVQVIRDITAATLGIPQDAEAYDLIQIVENPPRLLTSGWREVALMSEWQVTVEGFEDLDEEGNPKEIKPSVLIAGIGYRTVNPIVVNLTTEALVGFEGFVPDGKVLVIRPDGTASLGGVDVTSRVYARGVSLFDRARFDQDHFSIHTKGTPALRRGTSVWRYMAEGARFAPPESPYSRFDQAAFAVPPGWRGGSFEWSRFDEAVFARPMAKVQLQWVECQPATFVVRMPWDIIEPPDVGLDPRHLVKGEVDRVRAAGVRAVVEYQVESDRLKERQAQHSRLHLQSGLTGYERQRQREELQLKSRKTHIEEQLAADVLTFGGVFGATRFGSSRFI